MAIARDGSSVSGTYTQAAIAGLGPSGTGVTTVTFSPPANSLIEFSLGFNTEATRTVTIGSISNTGTALTWTLELKQENASGGAVAKWQAWNASAQSSITITVTATQSGAWGSKPSGSSGYVVDVYTGAKQDQSTAATPVGGTSTTQNNNFAITTTAANSLISVIAEDWNQTGTPTSSDTMEGTWNIAGQTAGGRARKTCGAAGAQTVNWQSGGASPQLTYVLTEILEDDGPAPVYSVAWLTA